MTAAAFPHIVTPEDLLRMPDSGSMELVEGKIVEKNVSVASSKTELLIASSIQAYLVQNPVAEVYPASLGYQCFADEPSKVRKPDVSVIRMERVRGLVESDPGFMPIVPDLAVEVISKNDTVYEVDQKVEEYLSAGFPLVWVVDPQARTLVVYPNGGKPTILTSEDRVAAEGALPGFSVQVAEFFPPLKG